GSLSQAVEANLNSCNPCPLLNFTTPDCSGTRKACIFYAPFMSVGRRAVKRGFLRKLQPWGIRAIGERHPGMKPNTIPGNSEHSSGLMVNADSGAMPNTFSLPRGSPFVQNRD